jgi:dTMP kinase
VVKAGKAPGLLVAFEGLDGCGKSTQLQRLQQRLVAAGVRVRALREPGGTELGEAVREVLLSGGAIGAQAEMLLYMAARAELYERRVLPALAAGETVLLDRSQYSTAAYQGAGLGLPLEDILSLADKAVRGRWPDRVLVLELDPELARTRLPAGKDRIERRDAAYFARVAGGFRALAAREPARVRLLDARGSPEEVAARVAAALADVLPA